MVSITCPCVECKHNGRGHKCTTKSINLKYRNMITVNEGRVDMWVCDKYELSAEAIAVDNLVAEMEAEIKRNIDKIERLRNAKTY